uniref:Uncharacterized protein n=1 Tax=mine drainage metagenome TaxID=410659 RepID=E6QC47_9ZZZZ
MYGAIRKRGTSTHRWNSPSATRRTGSVWLLMPLTGSPAYATRVPVCVRYCSTCNSPVKIMHTSTAWTRRKSPTGNGLSGILPEYHRVPAKRCCVAPHLNHSVPLIYSRKAYAVIADISNTIPPKLPRAHYG